MLARARKFKPAPHGAAATMFLRLLGVIYLLAFLSLWIQVDGLIGSQGIIPFADLLTLLRKERSDIGFWQLPTLLWLDSSDAAIHLLCGAGTLLACIAIVAPLCAGLWILLWAFYFSLYTAGQDFLGFQWDILLLETGFLAIFLSPLAILPAWRRSYTPSWIPLLLLWWLLFRLMVASGVVKITWGDPSWQLGDLTALTYHYETQCIPTWTAWYMHHLPAWLQKATCGAMYFIEIIGPTLFFLGKRLRRIGCILQVALQLVIIATGNYGFFNYLTLSLCVLLWDDERWPAWLRGKPEEAGKAEAAPVRLAWHWPTWIVAPVGACVFASSLLVFIEGLSPGPIPAPAWLRPTLDTLSGWTSPLQRHHVINSYGLFRGMTKERPEIVIEGSDDGNEWKAYEFKYKPGDLARRPVFVAPHQPRLDWQMWFEALRPQAASQWFIGLLKRILEGSPPVLELLERNPFPDKPPRFLRAIRYDYRFTTAEERQSSGHWWKRAEPAPYVQPVTIERFRRG